MCKKALCLIFAFLFSIESMAAAVSDNDGSAFITKAEFDSLKNNFQSQIDQYNTSIDSKIDNAIAAYLSGISISSQKQKNTLVNYAKNNFIYTFSKNEPLDYVYGWPLFWGEFQQPAYTRFGSANREAAVRIWFEKGSATDAHKQKKTVIRNLQQDTNNNWFAHWKAYHTDCIDTLFFTANLLRISDGMNRPANEYGGVIATGQGGTGSSGIKIIRDMDLIGQPLWNVRTVKTGWNSMVNGDPTYSRSDGDVRILSPILSGAECNGIDMDWGKVSNEEIVINKNYNYDMFSNYDRNYNWGYQGSYKTEFIQGFAKKNKDVWTYFTTGTGNYNVTNNPNILKYCVTGDVKSFVYSTDWSNKTTRSSTINYSDTISIMNYTNTDNRNNATFYFPGIGFETQYLTNWSRIVNPNTTSIATKEVELNNTSTGIIRGKDGKYYFSVCAGLPVADIEKKEQLDKLQVQFSETGSHIVWFSNRPFNPDVEPQSSNNVLTNETNSQYTITGGTYNSTYKGFIVNNQNVNFKIKRDNNTAEEIIYMKWAKFTAPSTIKANTGVKLGDAYIVTVES